MGISLSVSPPPELTQMIRSRMSPARWAHTAGVMETAVTLAPVWGCDPARARWAALVHDAMRDEPPSRLLTLAEQYSLRVDPDTMARPVLLHGPVAAAWAKSTLGITDDAILEAVSLHTLGAPGMGRLAELLYVADACEPGRDYPGVDEIRKAAREGHVRRACYLCSDGMIRFLLDRRDFIHPQAVSTRNWYLDGA